MANLAGIIGRVAHQVGQEAGVWQLTLISGPVHVLQPLGAGSDAGDWVHAH